MRRQILMFLVAVAGCFALSSCDKQDDNEGSIINEVLPGKWTVSYTFKGNVNLDSEVDIQHVMFNKDGTCALTYIDTYKPRTSDDGNVVLDEKGNVILDPVYGTLYGTYLATDAVIRIVGNYGGEEYIMLWNIISLSPKQIVAEYGFGFTVVVTLDKQN